MVHIVPNLSLSLEKMVTYSFIDEIKVPGQMYEGYKYRLTADGQDLANHVKITYQKEYEKINNLVATCKKFCNLKTAPLSYAAKMHYMLESNREGKKPMNHDDAIRKAEKLGWEITASEVEQGVQLLEQLKLVEVVRN